MPNPEKIPEKRPAPSAAPTDAPFEDDALPTEVEDMAEDVVREMTGDDDPITERDESMSPDESGGPWVETDAMTEISDDEVDPSWTRAPLPSPMRSEE